MKHLESTTFESFGLPPKLLASLAAMKISAPTPIQAASIPIALEGSDLLASAQTGSGKTFAYCIPMIVKLLQNSSACALILTPTRELATQVQQALFQLLGSLTPIKTALLIGGASMGFQMRALKARPRVIIGTPGRITDHLLRKSLSLKDTEFLVVDEADRMLDMGFGIQLEKIAEFLPEKRQTLMFSATFPPNIQKLSRNYLRDPKQVSIALTEHTTPKIKQEIIYTTHPQKLEQLLEQLKVREGSVIIFTKTKRGADQLSDELHTHGHKVNAIHGDLSQNRRDSVIRAFRGNLLRILVATDVAARGLDIPQIMHVICYDLPQCPEDYIHRIGRTGRAGAEGNALCFISPMDRGKWREILKLINPADVISHGKEPDQRRASEPDRRGSYGNREYRPRGPGRSFSRGPEGSSRSFSRYSRQDARDRFPPKKHPS